MEMAEPIRRPDLEGRPFELTVERAMTASPAALYRAWTQEFGRWFAHPSSVLMRPKVDAPFFFETVYRFEDARPEERHAHYGRFLRLEPDQLVEMTWVTGRRGTGGAETIVRVEMAPDGSGTRLKLSHSGFYDAAARDQHETAWPIVLTHQDEVLTSAHV
jgi:uncharacterized protein YndB with AHSA1/START domain